MKGDINEFYNSSNDYETIGERIDFQHKSYSSNIVWDKPTLTRNTYQYKANYIYVNSNLKQKIRNKGRSIFKKKSFLYHYLYFCSTIYYLSHTDKRFKELEYININYKVMSSIISERKYTEIVNNLENWGIITIDRSYSQKRKSKGYKLNQPYNMNVRKEIIKDKLINKKLNARREKQIAELHKMPYSYQYLEMTNMWINMDTKSAYRYNSTMYLNELDRTLYDFNFFSISAYDQGDYRFTVDTTGNRAHTNITNLKSDFRQFLTVEGEKLGQVDIKNSQPAFFYLLIKNDSSISQEEKDKYKELVESGRFYEFFMDKLGLSESDRAIYKTRIITAVFYDHYRIKESRYLKVFRKEFPTITNFIDEMKKKNNAELAVKLQKMESDFIIGTVVKKFIDRYGGNFISTIHDSVVAKVSQLELVESIMNECFENLNFKPKVSVSVFK